MSRSKAEAFNEWMRRFTETPKAFEAQFRTCADFLAHAAAGIEPDYGDICAAYLDSLMTEDGAPVGMRRSGNAMTVNISVYLREGVDGAAAGAGAAAEIARVMMATAEASS